MRFIALEENEKEL